MIEDLSGSILPTNLNGCDPHLGASGVAGARCADHVTSLLVDTDGGDDTVRIAESVPASVQVRVDGGPGADDLTGGRGNDILEAGDDNDPDRLSGGEGGDGLIGARTDNPTPVNSGLSTLIGGPGSDLLVGGDPCDGDLFDGGPGHDSASFSRFNPGVSAQIGGAVTRSGGSCNAGHVDASVEGLEGSPGPDTLIGDGNANQLLGRAGNDVLRGLGGADRLIGGSGSDRVDGGPGRDAEVE